MSILEAAFYVKDQAMSADWEGPILTTRGLSNLSFTGSWTDAASPVGPLQLWVTNDPRAAQDQLRGLTMATGAAVWKQLDLPAGSVDVDGTTATWTAGDDHIQITGVGAGKFAMNVVDLYAYAKLYFDNTSGGTGDTMSIAREGN